MSDSDTNFPNSVLLENGELVIRIKAEEMACKRCGSKEPMALRTLSIADGKGKRDMPWHNTDYRVYFDIPANWHYVGYMLKEPGYFCKKCYDEYRFECNAAKTAVHQSWMQKLMKVVF